MKLKKSRWPQILDLPWDEFKGPASLLHQDFSLISLRSNSSYIICVFEREATWTHKDCYKILSAENHEKKASGGKECAYEKELSVKTFKYPRNEISNREGKRQELEMRPDREMQRRESQYGWGRQRKISCFYLPLVLWKPCHWVLGSSEKRTAALKNQEEVNVAAYFTKESHVSKTDTDGESHLKHPNVDPQKVSKSGLLTEPSRLPVKATER